MAEPQSGILPDANPQAIFLTFLLVFIELPLFLWALIRGDLPPVETFESHREAGGDPGSAKAAA